MKRCTNCNHEKSEDEFHKNRKRKDGLQSFCKSCMIEIVRLGYKNNKATVAARQRNSLNKIQAIFDEIRADNGCCFCGESVAVCLDFHHIDPSEKDRDVSYWRASKSKRKMIEEMLRCAVVCANCHRKVHAGLLEAVWSHRCRINECYF